MDIKNKIQSLQQTLNVSYDRPDSKKLDKMISALRGSEAYKYLKEERGLTDETIEYFKLGYDSSKNAVAIPQFKDGVLINIKYRFLKPNKIRYTSEPNAEQWLFHDQGLTVAKEKGAVAIAEGEIDCMSLWQAGFKNVISPGSGANSYGTWIEKLDNIERVWIAYDSDEAGQNAAKELAERIGEDKCRNVKYPKGSKDANDYIKSHSCEDLRKLFAQATPFLRYEFNNLYDIVKDMISNPRDYLLTALMPDVKIYKDHMTVVSGVTNIGKSSYALNIALELARADTPVLLLPLERGPYNVGRRLIQIALDKSEDEIEFTPKEEILASTKELVSLPIYFAMPERHKLLETITRAKRLFGVRYVIIDQIDQAVRNIHGNKEVAISDTMRDLKKITESLPIAMMVVTHVRKLGHGEKISMDALKGSNSLSTDPETVILLDGDEDYIRVEVAKNKGKMRTLCFNYKRDTGVMSGIYDPDDF